MNREEILEEIDALPLYEMRDVKIADDMSAEHFVPVEFHKAIVEEGKTVPLVFVGKRYHLVQFKQVFKPVIDSIPGEMRANLIHNEGYAGMSIFPDDENLREGNTEFGVVATNSVDCSSAVVVKFCVKHKDLSQITIPPKVAGLKKMHTGSVANIVKDYMRMIGPVKEVWNKIITEFPKMEVIVREDNSKQDALLLGGVADKLKLGKRITKNMIEKADKVLAAGNTYTLWDLFVDSLETIDQRNYKSKVHRQRRVDKLSQAVVEYAFVLSL